MTNKKAEEVLKRLEKEEEQNKLYAIRVLGDEENKDYAFSILIHSPPGFNSTNANEYCMLTKQQIDLLREAEIEFEVIN